MVVVPDGPPLPRDSGHRLHGHIVIVAADATDEALRLLRAHPLGKDAAIAGTVTDEYPKRVVLDTEVGGRRFLDMPLGDPVPRIC